MSSQTLPIDEIYWNAVRMSSEDERRAYLDSVCKGNDPLRIRLVAMIQAGPAAEQFWKVSDDSDQSQFPGAGSIEEPGTEIGDYRLLEQIGEGGMGVVFVAEQMQPVRRKVALKIIKPGMDSRRVVARFEAERQTLAMMQHPSIAKVFAAGTTDSGRPYFVMELVRGIRITKYCDRHQLNTAERLQLFIQVCHAVQHAHQKGIIHRDLKPSNILVELHDVTAVPKIIDFGIAKAVENADTAQTAYTGFHEILGTPMYMSPEQAEFNALDVDTRSDVYSLGVLLYELLVGQPPFDIQRLKRASIPELFQIIREETPPRPSTRRSADPETVETARHLEPVRIQKRLRNELDWIVMKALEKDRLRRYQSATQLAEDLQRFLDNREIVARPPSLLYRLSKTLGRHKSLATASVVVVLSLLLGMLATFWQAQYADAARRYAEGQTDAANNALAQVRQQQLLTDQARKNTEWQLYIADMKLASDAYLAADIPRVRSLLERHQHHPWIHNRLEWKFLDRVTTTESVWRQQFSSPIHRIQVAPEGNLIAVAVRGGQVHFCDSRTGTVQTTLSISAECNSVAWSPDGTRLAVAGADGTIRILDPAASSSLSISELLANLTGPMSLNPSVSRFSLHQGEANDVLFTPDGNQIVSCGDDGSIHICEATTGRVIKTLSGHEREVEQLAISPDGKTLASASSDDFLRVWDLQTGTQRHGWTSHPKAARMVAVDISPDGTLVAAADIAGGIIVANIETGATSLTKQVDGIECITFSDDSRRVISGDRGGVIRSCPLDVDSKGNPRLIPEIARFWIGHRDYVTAAAADISDNRVVSGGKNGVLTSWSPGRMCVAWFLKAPLRTAWSDALKFVTARSDCLYVDLSKRRYGNLVDGEEREAIGTATQNSSHLLFEGDGMIAVTDRQTEMQVAQWTFPMAVHSAALSPDGLKVAVADRDERQYVRVYQCGREEPLFEVQAQQCNHLEFSSDGQTLAISAMNDVLLVDAASGSLCDRLQGHQTTVNQAAFSPDQKRLASVGDDRRLTVWHIDQAGQKTQPMNVRAHQGQVNGVDWSPDGRVIATVGGDLFLRLWDADSLQPLFTYRLLESGSAVRFVGDDQLLIPTVNGKLCVLGIASSTDDQL